MNTLTAALLVIAGIQLTMNVLLFSLTGRLRSTLTEALKSPRDEESGLKVVPLNDPELTKQIMKALQQSDDLVDRGPYA